MKQIALIESGQPHVALVELRNAPNNFVNPELMQELAEALEALDGDPECRCVVLAAEGRVFCAGANFNASAESGKERDPAALYAQAMRIFRTKKPIVAAVQGAAVGAGLGLAVAADFRVTCPEARFSANFNRIGFHPGFGLSLTLPRLVGTQAANLLFYTGRRIGGEEALRIGLADVLVATGEVRASALALAAEIALSAPLAVQSTRATTRRGWADEIAAANAHEREVQKVQFRTHDFKEGVAAMTERRPPRFEGR